MADNIISLDYKDLQKLLEKYEKEMPGIGVKLMRAVNNKAKAEIRAEYRRKGYHATKQMSWGDSGYKKNLKSYANKNFTGKIMMANNAFYYRFLEYGAEKPAGTEIRYKGGTYTLKNGWKIDAQPVIHRIGDMYWRTNRASSIMEKQFQKELDKLDKKKG